MTYEMEYLCRLYGCAVRGEKAPAPTQEVSWNNVLRLAAEQSVLPTVAAAVKHSDPGVTAIAASAFNNVPGVTLGVYYGTAAYDYARSRQMSYTLLDGALLGDTNGDGHISIGDVTAAQWHLASLQALEGVRLRAADIDGDGTVSIEDATLIQRFLAKYDVAHSVGKVITQ